MRDNTEWPSSISTVFDGPSPRGPRQTASSPAKDVTNIHVRRITAGRARWRGAGRRAATTAPPPTAPPPTAAACFSFRAGQNVVAVHAENGDNNDCLRRRERSTIPRTPSVVQPLNDCYKNNNNLPPVFVVRRPFPFVVASALSRFLVRTASGDHGLLDQFGREGGRGTVEEDRQVAAGRRRESRERSETVAVG